MLVPNAARAHTPTTTTFQTPRLYSVLECVCACVFAHVCVTRLHSEGQCSRCQLPHKGSFQVSPGRTLPPSFPPFNNLNPPQPHPPPSSTTNFWLVSSRSDARPSRSLKPPLANNAAPHTSEKSEVGFFF